MANVGWLVKREQRKRRGENDRGEERGRVGEAVGQWLLREAVAWEEWRRRREG